MFKFVRIALIYALTASFASIAMMGEGLHLLPGLGHSCCDSDECSADFSSASHLDGCNIHSVVLSSRHDNANHANNAADCPVCKFFSHTKPCFLPAFIADNYIAVSGRLDVSYRLLESRFACVYHSRAPPCCLLQV
jgi:hypothetical protein